jgi:3-hydroxyisobutyrate dehydrogenase-like beta-hydroxyacid dehydrogenase
VGGIGFVGLGAMGTPMVKRLLAAGHVVTGYNRTRAKAEALAPLGLRVAATPREAAQAGDTVLSMVTDSDALRRIAEGPDGILAGLEAGSVWADMSTVSPAVTRAMGAEVATRGATFLDAPVSGSAVTVEQGKLAFFVGGDPAALERVRPYLLAIGASITHMGALGLAVTMKVAINLGIGVQLAAFSESVLLAEKAGISRERAVEALLKSVLASPMLQYRGSFVVTSPAEPLFDCAMMQKDLGLALEMGRAVGVPLPTTALTHELLGAARAMGLGDRDCAAIFDVLACMSGVPMSKGGPQGGSQSGRAGPSD